MSFLRKLKPKRFGGNLTLLIISVVVAVIAWFMVAMSVYPSIPKSITNIKLDTDITGSIAAENNLSLISCNVTSVNVKILGSRTEIGNISADNLHAVLKMDNISTVGTKNVSIEIVCSNPNIEFEVESITPENATVVLDRYETKMFDVKPVIPNITYAEGKIRNDDGFGCSPAQISITAPSEQLNRIDTVEAISNKTMELNEGCSLTSDEIKVYSKDGTTVDKDMLRFDNTNFSIAVPLLTKKTVNLTVGVAGAPSNFDKSILEFDCSEESITIASKTKQLSEIPDVLEVGKIPLSDLVPGFTTSFNIVLDDYINMSNVETVNVTLKDDELAKKTLTIDNFEVSNEPFDYKFEVVTKKVDVDVVGPKDIIENITSSDIIADINLINASNVASQGSSFSYDVTFSCPKYDNVWVASQIKVILSRSDKTTGTTNKSDS